LALCHPAPPQTYTLSLHDALPISIHAEPRRKAAAERGGHAGCGPANPDFGRADLWAGRAQCGGVDGPVAGFECPGKNDHHDYPRSEEHTSELQSRERLVCRLLLEK